MEWLNDAAGGVIRPATAMYHAVGGVLHQTAGVPTLVVREAGPNKPCRPPTSPRAPNIDPTSHTAMISVATERPSSHSRLSFHSVPTRNLDLLLKILDDPYADAADGRPSRILRQSLGFHQTSACQRPSKSRWLPAVLRACHPHPRVARPPPRGRLAAQTADSLRAVVKDVGVTHVDPAMIDDDASIDWCAHLRRTPTSNDPTRRNPPRQRPSRQDGPRLGMRRPRLLDRGVHRSRGCLDNHSLRPRLDQRRSLGPAELRRGRHWDDEGRGPRPTAQGNSRRLDCRRETSPIPKTTSRSSQRT